MWLYLVFPEDKSRAHVTSQAQDSAEQEAGAQ